VSDVSAATGETTHIAGERRVHAMWCNGSSRCRISRYECRVFLLAVAVSCVAQLCDARAELLRVLKPFVACRNLIIVIPLYAWERIRVMTIS
jgi:hypothetical protein